MNKETILNEWKRKRKITTILAMFHACLVGLEYTSVSISALYYLNHILKTKHASMFYGLTVGSMYTSSIISSIVLGRYMDRARNARIIILGTGFLAIIGNMLYSLPFSPWLLVIGRFLCGFSDATFPVMTGEFTRCYDKNELNIVISKYGMLYTCSFAVGPCTPMLLQWLHYRHWPIILEPCNGIGILLMLIQILFAIFVYFGFSNLADEPGYKLFLESIAEIDESRLNVVAAGNDESVNEEKAKESNSLTVNEMFTDFNIVLVTFSSGFANFLSSMVDLQANMVCLYTLNWGLTTISVATGAAMSLNAVASIFSYKRLMNNQTNIYFLNLMVFALSWMNLSMILILHEHPIDNFAFNMISMVILLMLNFYSGCLATVTGRLLLFTLVPSHSSSSCEGIRISISRILCGISYYIAALVYPYMIYFFSPFIIILTFIYVSFLIRRKNFDSDCTGQRTS